MISSQQNARSRALRSLKTVDISPPEGGRMVVTRRVIYARLDVMQAFNQKDSEGRPVEFMYIVNIVQGHPWTGRIIWQSSVAKALSGPLQNFGNISVFLPASDSARAQGVAIGLVACEFKRFGGRYPGGLWHLAQNAGSLECSRH
jgi:hypothetical protein